MRAFLIMPKGLQQGKLIWLAPYLYPKDNLEEGISMLQEWTYAIERLVEEQFYGLTFISHVSPSETHQHFTSAFRWMEIIFYDDEAKIDLIRDSESYSLIVLPIGRLQIETAIVTETVCLFPPGEFYVHNPFYLDGTPFESEPKDYSKTKNHRDAITQITNVNLSVFHNYPLIVFRKNLTYTQFRSLNHIEDTELIRECSATADNLMDLIRFYNADYLLQDWLPSKAGIWADRHSAMFVYFPEKRGGHIICREVELRGFIKGIGMTADHSDQLCIHPLLYQEINDLQKLIRHALHLHTLVMETDDETMQFVQIFILLDFLGDPSAYNNFQATKSKLMPCLVSTKTEYHKLSARFKELTDQQGLRTAIVHTGKRLQDLIPEPIKRKSLFKELHGFVYTLITHMMFSSAQTWAEYDNERIALRNALVGPL
jgi:hypothetical protein